MKKLLIVLFLSLLTFTVSDSSPSVLAPTIVKAGEKIIPAGTSAVELEFDGVAKGQHVTIYIYLDPDNTGTVQFGLGGDPPASHYAYRAGDKVIFTIHHGRKNLWYQASAASQSFVPTY